MKVKTVRTLQGLKNKGTLNQWIDSHKNDNVLIWSNEWHAYWRSNGCGYTTDMSQAGIYKFGDAVGRTRHCGPEKKIQYYFIDDPFKRAIKNAHGGVFDELCEVRE